MLTDLYNASQDQRVPPTVVREDVCRGGSNRSRDLVSVLDPRLRNASNVPEPIVCRSAGDNVARFYRGDGRRLEARSKKRRSSSSSSSRSSSLETSGERQRWRISRSLDDCTDDCTRRFPVLTRLVIWVSQSEDSFLVGDRTTG